MSGEDWEKIRGIFERALEVPEPERKAYVETLCGGRPALCQAVEELLEHYSGSSGEAAKPSERRVFQDGELVAGRFSILRFIDRGGMGEVYAAYDERLRLAVALKTLHPDLSARPEGWERFRQEILTARGASHPNLCRVYDLIEHRTADQVITPCLTMELVEGETLAQYLSRARPLGLVEALALIRQIAAGLDALHEHGLVHGDLKPSNIMIEASRPERPRALVTDFGLAAAATEGEGPEPAGVHAGAPYFMAPELFRDARPSFASDIYAFGLIIDEMVTRERAYSAESIAALCFAKLHETPVPPLQRSDGLPPHWEKALLRCIDAVPGERFKSAGEVVRALENVERPPESNRLTRTVTVGGSLLALIAIAILVFGRLALPSIATSISVYEFENQTNSSSFNYLCAGTTDELMRRLSRVEGVKVVPMRTARPDSRQKDTSRFALFGRLQAYKGQISLSVSLVDNTTGALAWSDRYERKGIEDPLEMQGEIAAGTTVSLEDKLLQGRMGNSVGAGPAASILGTVRGWLGIDTRSKLARAPTVSNSALDHYMRARALVAERLPEQIQTGIGLFRQAVSEDPNFALAYASLADAYIAYDTYAYTQWPELVKQARAAADTAVRLDPKLAESHMALAMVHETNWEWKSALTQYEEALQLKPDLAGARRRYSRLLAQAGRFEQAAVEVRRAMQDDPYDPSGPYQAGLTLFIAGHAKDTIALLEPVVARRPDDSYAVHDLSDAYAWLGSQAAGAERAAYLRKALELADREASLEREMRADPRIRTPWSDKMYAHFYSLQGNRKQAGPYLKRLMEDLQNGAVSPVLVAIVLAAQDRNQEAIDLLVEAVSRRDPYSVFLRTYPFLASLRGEPRFEELVAKVGI
jgi:serine/threonine protein kinase/tetratricopeptide (TPR) repeat protein